MTTSTLARRSPYNAYRTRSTGVTPQSEKIVGKEELQTINSAGGVSFKLDPWKQLERFLILGTEGGTYYASEQKLTLENAKLVRQLIEQDGPRVVRTIVELSNGRVPKASPGLFVLAMCISFGDRATKRAVHESLPQVARTGTHIFEFVEFAQQFRGWGRVLRDAVANWYTSKEQGKLAYQAIKYQQRNGWSHKDLLRLSHAKREDNDVFQWIVKGWDSVGEGVHPDAALRQIWAFEKAKTLTTRGTGISQMIDLIRQYGLPRECVPTEFLKEKKVWEALLMGGEDGRGMPMTAMIRNLATMSRVGLLTPMSEASKYVCERLLNDEALKYARVHPIQLLSAYKVYSLGGQPDPRAFYSYYNRTASKSKGGPFEPIEQIKHALNEAFYKSFGNIEPSGKRTLLGFDVSGSMMQGEVAGVPGLCPGEAAALMGMVTARAEWSNGTVSYPMYHCIAFDQGAKPFPLGPTDSIEQVLGRMGYNGGGTDCSLPMTYALSKGIAADTFVVYTDNETWAGKIHPSEALVKYRKETGIPARLVVVGLTSTGFSIADPTDPGMLDVVGFDTASPGLISQFSRGDI